MTEWDAILNAQVIDGQLGYVVLSALRIMVAWASWLCVLSLSHYLKTTIPPPYNPENLGFWLRWWFFLRLKNFAALKVGIFLTAFLLILQLLAGVNSYMNTASVYLLLIYSAWLLTLIGFTQLLNTLRRQLINWSTHDI